MNLREALRLYLVTDPVICGPAGLMEVCRLALEAGVGSLQLRDKNADTRSLLRSARSLMTLAERHGCLFVVNDRVDVAMASGSHGVHLGSSDMPPAIARKMLGTDSVIGVSVRTPEEAVDAWNQGADYLAANIVFRTPTKPDPVQPLGTAGVRLLAEATPLPLVAIGGINAGNATAVMEAGAAGVAVVSAIMAAPDPAKAAAELRDTILNYSKKVAPKSKHF